MASVVIKKKKQKRKAAAAAAKKLLKWMKWAFFMRIKKVQFLLIILHHDDVDDFLVREKKIKTRNFSGCRGWWHIKIGIYKAPAWTFSLLSQFLFYFIFHTREKLINELFMCIFHEFSWEVQKALCIIHQFQFSFNNFHFYSNWIQSTLSHDWIVRGMMALRLIFM